MSPHLSIVVPSPNDALLLPCREPYPIERLLRDGLCGAVSRPDVPLLLERLGDLGRWNDEACREIRRDVAARSMAHPSYNERFVTDQLDRVGSGSAAGLRVRSRWVAGRLDRFTAHVEATYRSRGMALTSTRRAYYRALYVSCLMRANPGSTDAALATQGFARQSRP